MSQLLGFAENLFHRSWIHGLAIGVCALSLAGCATTQPLSQTPPAGVSADVAAPSIAAGDSWTYKVRDGFTGLSRADQRHEVVQVGGDRIQVAGAVELGDGSQVYDRQWNWLRRPATDLQTFEYSPAYQAFSFPLTAGKTWRSEATATDPRDGRRFPVRIEGRVLGWERVKVPAGEFDAIKVERRVFIGYWEAAYRGNSVIQEYEWYAPSVKWSVKREAMATYLSYAAEQKDNFGFLRVADDQSGGTKFLRDDWLIYELSSFKVR